MAAWTTGPSRVTITVGMGQVVEAEVGLPFVETIRRLAAEAGLGKQFRVYVDGDEIMSPDDAPEIIELDADIALARYDGPA